MKKLAVFVLTVLFAGGAALADSAGWRRPEVADFLPAPGNEVLTIGDDGRAYVWGNDLSLAPNWPPQAIGATTWIWSQPIATDIDGDTYAEVLVLTESYGGATRLVGVSATTGQVCSGCPNQALGFSPTSLATGSLSGAGSREYAFGTANGKVRIYDANLSSFNEVTVAGSAAVLLGIGETDGDANQELVYIAGSSAGGVVGIVDFDGTSYDATAVSGFSGPTWGRPVVRSIDGSPIDEIVYSTGSGSVTVLERVGPTSWATKAGWPKQTSAGEPHSGPEVADIVAGGDLEITVIVGDNKAEAWTSSGQQLAGFPYSLPVTGSTFAGGELTGAPGNELLVSAVGTDIGVLSVPAFDYYGRHYHDTGIASPPIAVSDVVPILVWINGKLVGSQIKEGDLVDRQVRVEVQPKSQPAPAYSASIQRKGSAELIVDSVAEEEGVKLETDLEAGRYTLTVQSAGHEVLVFNFAVDHRLRISDFVCYPNPMRGPAAFTFQSTSAARANLGIYTVTGKRICSMEDDCKAGFNSMRWDGRDDAGDHIATGTYMAVLTLTTPAEQVREISTVVCTRR